MNLILVGCEYAGKTTLANEIVKWTGRVMGGGRTFHDHFGVPPPELPPEVQEHLQSGPTMLKHLFQHYMINYHVKKAFYDDPDHNLVGVHIEDAVYAPLYYGYGGDDVMRHVTAYFDSTIMEMAPNTVLILLKASPEVIGGRMKESPHKDQIIQEKDIEYILKRFEQEYAVTLIRNKFELDTTEATVEQTLGEFVDKVEQHLTLRDQLRIQTHQAKLKGLLG